MNGRIALVVGALICLALAIGAPPLAAQTGVPSEADIGKALRPAPRGLGTHQGLPTLGTAPQTEESPNVHGAAVSSAPSTATPGRKSRPAAGTATASRTPASPEPRPSIAFNTIQFAFDSAQLTPDSAETLRNLGNALNHASLADQKAFMIEGHTDATGGRQYNVALSRHRADAVKDYLVREAGVSASRLRTVGKGPSEPVNRADPYAAENRRVVIANLGG